MMNATRFTLISEYAATKVAFDVFYDSGKIVPGSAEHIAWTNRLYAIDAAIRATYTAEEILEHDAAEAADCAASRSNDCDI